MAAAQHWMDVTANNLANASTNGFKRDGLAFNDMMVRQLSAQGGLGSPLGSLGSGATPLGEYTVFERGPLMQTSNPLDMALDSDRSMFAVQSAQGIRFTRDGSFSLNADHELVTKSGNAVLGSDFKPIKIEAGQVQVAHDGSISVNGKLAGKVGVFDGTFEKEGDNLFTSSTATSVEQPSVLSSMLEGSNVNAVEAMISMITLSRSFEMAQKSIQQQDDLSQRLIQSLSGH